MTYAIATISLTLKTGDSCAFVNHTRELEVEVEERRKKKERKKERKK